MLKWDLESARSEPAEWPRPSPATARTFGILIVDDEACVRRVLSIAMRQLDFAVWLAADGQEALELYRRHRAAIDVVLMDVVMPGLDGPKTLAALQNLDPQIRCCFMGGDLGSYTEWQLSNLSAAAVLRKPFGLAEVGQLLGGLARKAAWRR